jgi:prophage regulatory protein
MESVMHTNESSINSVRAGWRALREPAVCETCGLSKSQLWRLINRGDFPKPTKLSARVNAWDSRKIDAWLAEKFGGAA